MKKLYSPENNADLAIIESMLDGEGIKYFVHNDHFGTLEIGPKIDLYNAKTIMVSDDQYGIAMEIINDFCKSVKKAKSRKSNYSFFDKIRMLIEIVMMNWVIPGNKWKKKKRRR